VVKGSDKIQHQYELKFVLSQGWEPIFAIPSRKNSKLYFMMKNTNKSQV